MLSSTDGEEAATGELERSGVAQIDRFCQPAPFHYYVTPTAMGDWAGSTSVCGLATIEPCPTGWHKVQALAGVENRALAIAIVLLHHEIFSFLISLSVSV